MRIALISDIHGNLTALDAVLNHIQQSGGVDSFVFVGDYVAIGPEPVEVFERLCELENAVFIRGNTDRYTFTGDRPRPTFEEAGQDEKSKLAFIEIQNSFAWTQGAVATSGCLDWLSALPLDYRLTFADGSTALCVHARPGHDDGPGIDERSSPDFLSEVARESKADYLFVGHTHEAVEIVANGTQIWNLGSVSNPPTSDLRASYLMIESSSDQTKVVRHRINYDVDCAIKLVRLRYHPAAAFIEQKLLGK